jgi:hypothetical protein
MNPFVRYILWRHIRYLLIGSAFAFSFFYFFPIFDDESYFFYGSYLAFFILLLPLFSAAPTWITFWKRTSSSINSFWKDLFLLIGILSASALIISFILFPWVSAGTETLLRILQLYGPEEICFFFIVLTGLFCLDGNLEENAKKHSRHPIKYAFFCFLAYGVLAGLTFIYLGSHLLGFLSTELVLLFSSFFLLPSAKKSFYKPKRIYLFSFFLLVTLVSSGLIFSLAKALNTEKQFVGFLAPSALHELAPLEQVKTTREWMLWYGDGQNIPFPLLEKSLEKLYEVCPLNPTDHALNILCEKNDEKSERDMGLTNVSKSEEILSLLRSENPYAQLLGIVSAKTAEKFPDKISEEITGELKRLSQTEGSAAYAAYVALHSAFSKSYKSVRIYLRDLPQDR